ncbi:MAG: alanine racemase [Verrucomicrobia bacterium]|nr:MAG: alanine racemase [Verrucomicrobiota bacterium]
MAALRARAPAGSALMAVVKADAYGHGVRWTVPELRDTADWLGVACLQEALQVRQFAPKLPVLILGPALPEERLQVAREGFFPVVSNFEEAAAYSQCSGSVPVAVHLAVDTGMGRIGVWETEAAALARAIQKLPGVRLAGVGSHFPSADEDVDLTLGQSVRFEALVREMRAQSLVEGPAHIANSAGMILFPNCAGELFRAGLTLFGCSPRPEFQEALKPVLTWKTRVTLVREVAAGRGVSYGSTYVTPAAMRIATLAVGYADGFRRHLSGREAAVLIGGRRCAVLGRVTMDQILVDVSGLEGVEVGSEVVLLGTQGGEALWVSEMAERAGTIPWDIFTGIGPRVVRAAAE